MPGLARPDDGERCRTFWLSSLATFDVGADPYGRPAKVFEAMQRELDEAIDVIVAWEASFPA